MIVKKCKKVSSLILVAIGMCIVVSCSGEGNQLIALNSEELISMEEVDDVMEDISNIINEVHLEEETTIAFKGDVERKKYLADCATKTVLRENGVKTVTIDFGDSCEMRNGKIAKGKLILTYAFDKELRTKEITNTFDAFSVNDKQINGTSTSLHIKGSITTNPSSSFTEDITINWEDGATASRVGYRSSEMIEGFGDRDWSNNVYKITGKWISTSKNGTVHSVEITTPLRKELACRFIVSGVKSIEKAGKVGTINFGDGTCDSVAVFTNEAGEGKEISLGRDKEK